MHPENEPLWPWMGLILPRCLADPRKDWLGSAERRSADWRRNRRGFSSSSRAGRFARNYHDNCGMHNSWSSASHVRWLAVACFTALVVGAPFLLPLVVTYRLREVNLAPSHFIGGLFRPRPIALRLLVSFLPALLALPAIALLAQLAPLDRTARQFSSPG